MAGLTGKTIASNYKSLLRVNDDTNGVDAAVENVTDGEGTASALGLSDDAVQVKPQNDDTTSTFTVKDKAGNNLLLVDSTNDLVKVNGGQDYANTMYAHFGTPSAGAANILANNHYAIPFGHALASELWYLPTLGTGTDPSASLTVDGTSNGLKAAEIGTCLWHVPDAISIDSVTHIEGADAATGDTTRMHLMSYTFNSGVSGVLTDGVVVASSSDITNAGYEQVYKSNWTVNSASVAANKVIACTFRADSVNSDYSLNVIIKYHLV